MQVNKLKDGTKLNRNQYEIIKFIGSGGFGITYLANHVGYYKSTGFGEEYEKYQRPIKVVIKELFYDAYCNRDNATGLVTVTNPSKEREFEKLVNNQLEEGKIVRQLKHRNIVRTRDIFKENDTAYMVMDYIESIDLEDLLEVKNFLPPSSALRYIYQVLDAVDYFHNHGFRKILHLDIKPSNILLDKSNDKPIIIDFGSALSYDPNKNQVTSRTSQLITGRTQYYAPNEQNELDNLKTFEASFDTYAIGATLYHLLTGAPPPDSGKVSSGYIRFEMPSEKNPNNNISNYLDEVVAKSLAPKFKERFNSAMAFKRALENESNYTKDIENIERNINDKEFVTAEALLDDVEIKYISTQKVKALRVSIVRGKQEREKIDSYNDFLQKAIQFYELQEYKQAIRYFEFAAHELPHKNEPQEWIEKSRNKLKEKDNDDISDLLKRFYLALETHDFKEAKGIVNKLRSKNYNANELLILNTKLNNAQSINTLLIQFKENVDNNDLKGAKSVIKKLKETNYSQGKIKILEEELPLETEPEPEPKPEPAPEPGPSSDEKGNTIKINPNINSKNQGKGKTTPIRKKNDSKNEEKKKNPYLKVLAIFIAVTIGLFLIFILIGVFTKEVPEPGNIVDSDSDIVELDSTNLADVENDFIEGAADANTLINGESEATIPTWKIDFDKEFSRIRNRENSQSPQASKTAYQRLLNTLPTSASNEKNQIKTKISDLDRKIERENARIAAEEAKRMEQEKAKAIEEEARKRREAENLAEYKKKLRWSKNMIDGNGLEWCKTDPNCKNMVTKRLKEALQVYPNGTEARNLLNEFR